MTIPNRGDNPIGDFIITIDTEGDDAWNSGRDITTRNALYLPRFQDLCERHGLRPTYLVDYEMALSPVFVEFGRDVLRRDQGEIGMHLHAWNSPPIVPLTNDDARLKPFLIEYPEGVLRAKIDFMTKLLGDVFDTPITSHRAGRWALDEPYAQALISCGYLTDCSVTPHVNWHKTLGAHTGGADYRHFPETPYFMSPYDIRRPGRSPLLEVPMTISKRCPHALRAYTHTLDPILGNRWLRPNGHNRRAMMSQVAEAAADGAPHVEFMLHSSELMPAGSPTFPDTPSIERLYADLEELFETSINLFKPATLDEFRQQWADPQHDPRPSKQRI